MSSDLPLADTSNDSGSDITNTASSVANANHIITVSMVSKYRHGYESEKKAIDKECDAMDDHLVKLKHRRDQLRILSKRWHDVRQLISVGSFSEREFLASQPDTTAVAAWTMLTDIIHDDVHDAEEEYQSFKRAAIARGEKRSVSTEPITEK